MNEEKMKAKKQNVFASLFLPRNILAFAGIVWFLFISAYPMKYLNPTFTYSVILIAGIAISWAMQVAKKDIIISLSTALLFTALMPIINDNVFADSTGEYCEVIGKYHWVSPNQKNKSISPRYTYQLKCSDGVKEAGGPLFSKYEFEIGERVDLKVGIFNFEFI
jgi:hypothetical protein